MDEPAAGEPVADKPAAGQVSAGQRGAADGGETADGFGASGGFETGEGLEAGAGLKAGAGLRTGDSGGDGTDSPADPEEVARLICLRLLTAAPRTKAELAAALRRRRVPQAAAAAVLERFAEVGLIDDAMFASSWVESRHHGRGLGRRALTSELSRRGVDRDDIEMAVAQLTPETELATARALVERKLRSTSGLPAQARIGRLAGMLARKGYPPGIAYRAVREALDQAAENLASAGLDDTETFDGGLFDPDMFDPGPADGDFA